MNDTQQESTALAPVGGSPLSAAPGTRVFFEESGFYSYPVSQAVSGRDVAVVAGLHEGMLTAVVIDRNVTLPIEHDDSKGVSFSRSVFALVLGDENEAMDPFIIGEFMKLCGSDDMPGDVDIVRVTSYINRLLASKFMVIVNEFARDTKPDEALEFDAGSVQMIHAAMTFAIGVIGDSQSKLLTLDYLLNILSVIGESADKKVGCSMSGAHFYVCRELVSAADMLTDLRHDAHRPKEPTIA